MRSGLGRCACAAAVVVSVWLAGAEVCAQEPTPLPTPATPDDEEKERAKQLFRTGRELYEAKDYAGALIAFQEAERLAAVPSIMVWMARTQMQLGQLVEAQRRALAAAVYPKELNEPEQYKIARTDAAALAQELAPRIPTVELQLSSAAGAVTGPVFVEVDGVRRAEPVTGPFGLDPGHRELRVIVSGYDPAPISVDVIEADRKTVPVVLVPVKVAPPPAPPPPPPQSSGPPLLAIVGLSAGGVGIAIGAITGGLSLGAASDAEATCPAQRCPDAAQDDLDGARTLGEISNASFGAGAAAAALGAVAWIAPADGGRAGDRPGGLPPVAWAGFGVGAAGIITAGVTGGLSLAAHSDAEAACVDPLRCPDAAMEDETRSRSLGGVATVAGAAGVVGVAMGLAGWLSAPAAANETAARVSPLVGPGTVGLGGEF